jgi:hypothetical protein
VLVPLLIALGATQPALRTRHTVKVRGDAGVFVVVDTSSSMLARSGPKAPTRLALAKRVAIAADAGLAGIPTGIATITDRVLPDLFPSLDSAAFTSTANALVVNGPPPRETQRIATTFGVLASLRRSGFFAPAEHRRALLLVTDGESRPFDSAVLARALAVRPAVRVLAIRVGGGGDRLYTAAGRAGSSYRADPARARRALAQLTAATGGHEYTSGAAAAAAIRSAFGEGPTTAVQQGVSRRNLASWFIMSSLLPLLIVLWVTAPRRSTWRFT